MLTTLDVLTALGTDVIHHDDNPDLNAKIQELHCRRNALNPQIAGMLADVPTFRGAVVDE
jgi:hypothetical protein